MPEIPVKSVFRATALLLIAALAVFVTMAGLADGWLQPAGRTGLDVYSRFNEWRLFAEGIYPMFDVASRDEMALDYFQVSVYPPWALPMFGLFFSFAGYWGGTYLILILSLASLFVIGRVGYAYMRPLGRWAGWIGACAPIAILGNRLCLSHVQFSLICVAFVTLQWYLDRRNHPYWSSICWVFAMLKPQIGFAFVLPMLRRNRLPALTMSIGILAALSFTALVHTSTNPAELLKQWMKTLPGFIGDANSNLSAVFLKWDQMGWLLIFIMLFAVVGAVILVFWLRRPGGFGVSEVFEVVEPMELAAVCAVVGYISVYHYLYDKAMLYPLLLVVIKNFLRSPRVLSTLMAAAVAGILWVPERLLLVFPTQQGQTALLSLVGAILMLGILRDVRARSTT